MRFVWEFDRKKFKLMKILVIGNGLIGSEIAKKMSFENHSVLVFSRNLKEEMNYKQLKGDIFNFDSIKETLKWKPDIVINTAWITTPGVYKDDESNYDYAKFTVKLAKYVSQSQIKKLIILGTCAEYGSQTSSCLAGTTKLNPNTLYAKQKVDAFLRVKEISKTIDLKLIWARIFYPYGPKQDSKRLIPKLINSLKRDEEIELADITSIYDWITTRDVADAISWSIHHEVPFEIDIGTGIGYTNLEILRKLESLLQRKNRLPENLQHNVGLNEKLIVSSESPLFKSGWKPKDSLDSGLQWMLNNA